MKASEVLFVDAYQLSMMQGYVDYGMFDTAVFEFFVRRLPRDRNFLVAAGLDQIVEYLENVRFSTEDLEWLARSKKYKASFLDYLSRFRFTGEVNALPEGSIFFPDEPMVQVIAPLPEAQFIETRLMNYAHFQTVIASKAARMVLAAPEKRLVDFGVRRSHGWEAGLLAARASYVAGFSATSTLDAARIFGIPFSGTMAHSFIEAHDDESLAFEHFARSNPDGVTLLLDTYDTTRAAKKVVELAPELARREIAIQAVRLDSGNLSQLAKSVREILDRGGLTKVSIFASGGLDEKKIAELLLNGAPIDGFGIGTALTTSSDAPSLDCAYKLQEYAGKARRKRSAGKATWPGRKQVYRYSSSDGIYSHDLVTLAKDPRSGDPLLVPVMRHGKRVAAKRDLSEMRERTLRELQRLPRHSQFYEVRISPELERLKAEFDAEKI